MSLGFERWEDATASQLYQAFITYFDSVIEDAEELDFEVIDDGALTEAVLQRVVERLLSRN